MPRRVYTYEAGRGWEWWNLIVGIGALFQVAGILCFVCNLVRSFTVARSRDMTGECVDVGVGYAVSSAGL